MSTASPILTYIMSKSPQPQDAPAETCPVDHTTRAAWLKSNPGAAHPFPVATQKANSTPNSSGNSCDSSTIDQSPPPSGLLSKVKAPFSSSPKSLGVDREISTIPRASVVNGDGSPANNEEEGGVSKGGNWIYPSEKMFFDAMKRKGYKSEVADMKTIVPIHNAVNERAWKEIKEWERPWGSDEK
jgi:cytochrome c heme-lyase